MAWRTPTRRDFAATLSSDEIEAYQQSPDFATGASPADDIIREAAATVRAYCRRNRQIVVAPGSYDIPESLMATAMDIAAFRILRRFGVPVNESRTKAYEDARDTLDKVARSEIIPESYNEADSASNMAKPLFSVSRVKRLNRYPMV